MDFIQAIILGLIQGVTEWLPVSSKAIVSLSGKMLFGMDYQEALTSAVFLHTGTLLAAIAYFRNDIIAMVKGLFEPKAPKSEAVFITIAPAMTGIVGLPLMIAALNLSIPDWIFTVVMGLMLLYCR